MVVGQTVVGDASQMVVESAVVRKTVVAEAPVVRKTVVAEAAVVRKVEVVVETTGQTIAVV